MQSRRRNSRYLENVEFLIVDPNAFMRSMIKNVLSAFGSNRFVESTDGADAFREMRAFAPDIILTESSMSPIDGNEFSRLVRRGADSPNPYVPIIMITGYTEAYRVEQARDAGINEFLAKPISAKTLCQRITSVIERPRPFIRCDSYFGPDRRRRHDPTYRGPERRSMPSAPKDNPLTERQVDELLSRS